jgi:hypothetical protein
MESRCPQSVSLQHKTPDETDKGHRGFRFSIAIVELSGRSMACRFQNKMIKNRNSCISDG